MSRAVREPIKQGKGEIMPSREDLRVSLFLPVEVEDLERGRMEIGLSRNLSTSGILVSLEKRVPPDREYRITFSFPGVKRPLQFKARCVRSNLERGSGGSESFLTGFTFIEIPTGLKKDLQKAVQEKGLGIVNFLAERRPFHSAPREILYQITGVLRLLPLREGENCPPDRELSLSMMLVRKGLVKFSRPGSRQGKEEAVLALPGQVIGEGAFLEKAPHGFRVRALEDSELLVLGPLSQAFLEVEMPEAARELERICREIQEQRKADGLRRAVPMELLPALA